MVQVLRLLTIANKAIVLNCQTLKLLFRFEALFLHEIPPLQLVEWLHLLCAEGIPGFLRWSQIARVDHFSLSVLLACEVPLLSNCLLLLRHYLLTSLHVLLRDVSGLVLSVGVDGDLASEALNPRSRPWRTA